VDEEVQKVIDVIWPPKLYISHPSGSREQLANPRSIVHVDNDHEIGVHMCVSCPVWVPG